MLRYKRCRQRRMEKKMKRTFKEREKNMNRIWRAPFAKKQVVQCVRYLRPGIAVQRVDDLAFGRMAPLLKVV